MKNSAIITVLFFVYATTAAQEIEYPSDPDRAKLVQEHMALFSDNFKAGNYEKARISLDWLVENQPGIAPVIYINGIKLYESLEQQTANDAAKQSSIQEKILWLYDQRMVYFQDKSNAINRKAYSAYKFFIHREDKYDYLLRLFDEAFKSEDKYILNISPMAYMDVVKRYQEYHKNLTKEGILERYNRISSLMKSKPGPEGAMDEIDRMLLSIISMDCEEIADRFGIRDEKSGNELESAKKFMAYSLAYKCVSHPMFLKSAAIVFQHEPTLGLAKILARLSEAKEDYETAERYLHEAVKLASDADQTSEVNFMLAEFYQRRDRKEKSKTFALKAADSKEFRSRAYRLIGDLYLASAESCTEGKSPLADRAIYLAAFEMYKMAGDESMMNMARKQFPSAEDIHAENKKEGERIRIGCWINESVAIQKRP